MKKKLKSNPTQFSTFFFLLEKYYAKLYFLSQLDRIFYAIANAIVAKVSRIVVVAFRFLNYNVVQKITRWLHYSLEQSRCAQSYTTCEDYCAINMYNETAKP